MLDKSKVRTAQRPPAQNNRADGARSLFIGDRDVPTGRILFDGHFRNDGDAHAGTDHAEKTAELSAFENNLGMKTSAIAGGDGSVSKTVAITKEQEGFGAKIF